jgi:hypothetical protein
MSGGMVGLSGEKTGGDGNSVDTEVGFMLLVL